MSNITISVIIPVYNVEKYLPKCLDSVCAQADCVREIILINDGSTDGSLAICKSYAQKDERIKIIEQENKGLSATVRVGVRVATCDYVGFVDSDDYIEPDMYKILSEELVNAQAQIAWCEYNRVNEAGKNLDIELTESGKVEAFEKRDGKFPIPVYPLPFVSGLSISGSRCNKLIKKDLLINNISFEDFGISFGEDLALIAPVMFTADKIVYVRQYLYHYLQRDTSIVHVYKRSCFDDYIKIIDIIDRARNKYDYQFDKFDEFKIRTLYSNCLTKIRISNLNYKQRKKELKYIGSNPKVRAMLKQTKITGDKRFKLILSLLKHKMYGLLAILINKGAKK